MKNNSALLKLKDLRGLFTKACIFILFVGPALHRLKTYDVIFPEDWKMFTAVKLTSPRFGSCKMKIEIPNTAGGSETLDRYQLAAFLPVMKETDLVISADSRQYVHTRTGANRLLGLICQTGLVKKNMKAEIQCSSDDEWGPLETLDLTCEQIK